MRKTPSTPRRKKKRRKDRPMKPTCQSVLDASDELGQRSMSIGLDVLYSHFVSRGRKSVHIMFDFFGERILNWWPGTGTTYSFDGQKEHADDIDAVLALAAETLKRHANTKVYTVIN
jgi:hypothetical protein